MLKLVVLCAVVAGAVTLTAHPASAFASGQSGVTKAFAAVSDVIEVKRWKKKGRPPGWDRGRKTGWRGGSVPPGQR